MNDEKTKKFLLFLLITITLGGSIWAIISLTYSPIKELRSNNISETNGTKLKNNVTNPTRYVNDIKKLVITHDSNKRNSMPPK